MEKINGELSDDRKYLVIAPYIRFVIDPFFYRNNGFGELGLMPKGIEVSEENRGLIQVVNETFSEERFGNLTLKIQEGDTTLPFRFHSTVRNREDYLLRQSKYKNDDIFSFYLQDQSEKIGIAVVNFEEEGVAKLLGIGIRDDLQRQGRGTALLAGVERECSKNNDFLLIHKPIGQIIPFYVKRGFRYLEHPNGLDLAKVLHPNYDERLLM